MLFDIEFLSGSALGGRCAVKRGGFLERGAVLNVSRPQPPSEAASKLVGKGESSIKKGDKGLGFKDRGLSSPRGGPPNRGRDNNAPTRPASQWEAGAPRGRGSREGLNGRGRGRGGYGGRAVVARPEPLEPVGVEGMTESLKNMLGMKNEPEYQGYGGGHQQSYNGPPQGYNGPPQGYNGPPQGYNGPPQLQQGYNGPPQGYGGPTQQPQVYGGPQGYAGPSQGYQGSGPNQPIGFSQVNGLPPPQYLPGNFRPTGFYASPFPEPQGPPMPVMNGPSRGGYQSGRADVSHGGRPDVREGRGGVNGGPEVAQGGKGRRTRTSYRKVDIN